MTHNIPKQVLEVRDLFLENAAESIRLTGGGLDPDQLVYCRRRPEAAGVAWLIGSNLEDGSGTYLYYPGIDAWVYREARTGRDTPATFEAAKSDASIWFTG